jgi:hypothetical protein
MQRRHWRGWGVAGCVWWAMKYDRALFAELWPEDGDVPPVLRS